MLILAIFEFAVQHCFEHEVELLLCRCKPHLMRLDQAVTFRSYKDSIEYPATDFMVPLVAIVADIECATQIHSPLSPLFLDRSFDPSRIRTLNERERAGRQES